MFDVYGMIYSISEPVKIESVKTLDEAIEATIDYNSWYDVWYEKRV